MHEVNHPDTLHLVSDIWEVDPVEAVKGRAVGLAWFSPDCKHFSKAKGGKPVEKKIRGLAWVVVHWANTVRPRVIILENVEEFQTWGPLGPDNKPCPVQKGVTFKRWVGELERLGYVVEWRELRASDYGAPTIRKRLFLIARRDGRPIVWPQATHGDPKSDAVKQGALKPWRTAAEIIDWSLPCPSIFATSAEIMAEYGIRAVRPLQPATMARIAKGVKRYVLDAAKPFIVNLTHQGAARTESLDDPVATVTGAHRGEKAIVAPTLVRNFHGEKQSRPITDPVGTLMTGNHQMLAASFISAAQQGGAVRGAEDPLHTVTASAKDQNQVVAAHLATMRNADKPHQGADQPAHTVTAGGARMHLVAAFMAQHNVDWRTGEGNAGRSVEEPVSTVMHSGSHQSLVSAGLTILKGKDRRDRDVRDPAPAVLAEGGHVATSAFLQKYYGVDQDPQLGEPLHTATTKDRFGVVTVDIDGEPYVITDIGMRMLTPRELFRAQGFPDWEISCKFDTWRDPITQPAEDHHCPANDGNVKFAETDTSPALEQGSIGPVVVDARIDLGLRALVLHSHGKSTSSVPSAENIVSFPLPTEVVASAQRLAHTNSCEAPMAPVGKAEARPNARPSILPFNGGTSATTSGGETGQAAVAAQSDMRIRIEDSKCITSQDGPSSQNSGSILQTLCCYVANAIATSTLASTSSDCSFDVRLTVEHRYVIDRRPDGSPISKTDQVSKCGNSVCPPIAAALVAANYRPDEVEPAPEFLEAAE
jgi:DNA (cytosine-5)-methyltransferase 1